MQADSLHSVQSSYPSYVGSFAVLGASGTTILNKIPGIPHFLALREKKTLFGLNSGIMLFQMLEEISMNSW